MKRRFIAFLIALTMVLGMIPAVSAAEETVKPEIARVNMTLSGILHVNFRVDAHGTNMSGYEMHVYTGNDTEPQVITHYSKDEDGLYVFRADLIAHRMMETLTVKLMHGDEMVDEGTWDIQTYVNDVKGKYEDDTKLHDMLDAMIYYGQYVQYYAHHTEGIPDPDIQKVKDVQPNMLEDYQFLFAQSPDWRVGANLYLDDSVDIQFTFKTDKDITVTVNGKPQTLVKDEETGWQICNMEEILPQDWSKVYTVVATTGTGDEIKTEMALEYGVYSYIYSKLQRAEVTTGLYGVIKSMYLFGQAVSAYASDTGLHHIVSTPNLDRVMYENGVSQYYLVFDYESYEVSNPAQREAAMYINRVFNQIDCGDTGYIIKSDLEKAEWNLNRKWIILGNEELFEKAGLEMPQAALGATGYYIVTKGNSVFVMVDEYADEHQAYQLAAMELMRQITGYLQYSDDCAGFDEDLIAGRNITIPDMEIIEKPDMDFRLPSAYQAIKNRYDMGYTTNNMFIPVNGETYHTALKLLDPNQYYGEVKEGWLWDTQTKYPTAGWFFCDDVDTGLTGIYNLFQLCYSTIMENAEIEDKDGNKVKPYDIIYQKMQDAILAADPSLYNISFGIADNNLICNCSKCQAYDGGAVGAYLDVANRLAVDIARDPEIFAYNQNSIRVMVMAYRQYFELPQVKDGDVHLDINVAVMLAPISASCNTPLQKQTGENGGTNYPAILEAWSAEANHMYLWLYQANFNHYMYPMNSWEVMQQNLLYARSLGVELLFYQGMNDATNGTGFTKLKEYLETEWAYQADQPATDLVPDFFQHYFGPAWEQMAEFYQALSAHMKTLKESGADTGNYKEAINTTANWPQAKLQEFMGYVNEAYEAVEASGVADAGDYIERIRLESMFPRFALLELYQDTTNAGTYAAFKADCDRLELNMYCEHTDWDEFIAGLSSDLKEAYTCTHAEWRENADAKYFCASATEASGAQYYKSCTACGAVGTDTFVSGDPLAHVHSYTFAAGTGENEGYDVGTCACGETVKVKTDYTASAPVDIINGTAATLNMPEGFQGTVTGVKFGQQDVGYADGKINTTTIQQASHGTWAAIEVTFTSAYGGSHTAQVPVILITKVISTKDDFASFATEAANAWAGGTVMYGYYILDADIDCSGTSVSAADAWNNGQFYGTLDGRGHKVKNLTAAAYKTGIFGRLHGTVKDIHFTDVAMSANSALFGKIVDGSTFTNVTIDVASWGTPTDNTYTGILGLSQNQNLVLNNLVINVADGITVPQLIGRQFTGATGNVTVNLGVDVKVINYYSTANSGNSGVTTLPSNSIFTVNQKIAQIIDNETIIEGNTMPVTGLSDGSVSVLLGGNTYSGTVASGVLTIENLPTATGKLTDSVVVTQNDNKYTYTNIWHVTQVIDTVAELKALGTLCKDSIVTGYYILGGNIDCSAQATMSNGSGSTTTNGFSGTFDGRGYTISNIKMTWDSATSGLGGLFGKLLGATIQNTVFDNVNLGTNGTLLASGAAAYNSSNVNLKNITINLVGYSTSYGVVVGYDLLNTIGSNVVINVADGLTVKHLLSRDNCNSIGYITATVNLGAGSTITNYYGTTTAKPDTITVNAARESTVATVDTLVAGENATSVTFTHNAFADSTSATVVINDVTKENVAISGGTLTLDLADYGVTAMGQYNAVITTNHKDVITFSDVWYVTQVIDDATELKALGTLCKDSIVTGYYILGGNIDCSAQATMSNGSASSTTNGFQGTFDGRGLTISNIKMTWDSATGGLGGLFGKLLGCTIKNTTFDNVNLGTNGTLLASGADKNSATNTNTSLQNLTINLTGYSTSYGVVVGYSMFNTVGSGIVINVADGLTVASLMARDNCNSIAYIYATVNLGTGSTITNYYSGATTAPSTFTVNNK